MEKLKIAIGCDHGGFNLKNKVIDYLKARNIEYKDFGIYSLESSDYPEVAKAVAKDVTAQKYDRGILVCGTGLGMSIAANKVKGIRAVTISDTYSARVSRAHNNANVLVMPGRFIDTEMARKIMDEFFATEFEGGRHQERIESIPVK